jgi:hypothetical protein
MEEEELKVAHKACMRNRDDLEISGICGCFYCLAIFRPSLVKSWVDDEQTALCPYCSIDSVLPSSKHAKWVTDEFLAAMNKRWFRSTFE